MESSARMNESPIVSIPASVVPVQPGVAGWFKQNVAGHLLTLIVGGSLGFVGSWYTLQAKVGSLQDRLEHQDTRLIVLEATAARKEDMQHTLDSIDKRLGNIERALMAGSQK